MVTIARKRNLNLPEIIYDALDVACGRPIQVKGAYFLKKTVCFMDGSQVGYVLVNHNSNESRNKRCQ